MSPDVRDSASKCACGHPFSLHQRHYGTTACSKSSSSEIRRTHCGCQRYEGATS